MAKHKLTSKSKIIIAFTTLSVLIVAGVVSLVLVLAASRQQVSSNISVTYVSNNVSADVTGKYWVSGSEKVNMGDTVSFQARATSQTKNTAPATNIQLTTENDRVYFEYGFKNNSRNSAFTIELIDSPQALNGAGVSFENMKEQYYVSAVEVPVGELDDMELSNTLNIQPVMKQRVDASGNLEDDTVYIYIVASIDDPADDASYSGSYVFSLDYVQPSRIKTVTLDNGSGTGPATMEIVELDGSSQYEMNMPCLFDLPQYQSGVNCTGHVTHSGNTWTYDSCYSFHSFTDNNMGRVYISADGSPRNGVSQVYYSYNERAGYDTTYLTASYDSHPGHEYAYNSTLGKYVCKRCGQEHDVTSTITISDTTYTILDINDGTLNGFDSDFLTYLNGLTQEEFEQQFPEGIHLFLPTTVDEIAAKAFQEPNFNGQNNKDGTAANKHYVTCLYMSGTVTSIDDYAFNECHNLRYFRLEEGLTHIGEYAFHHLENNQQNVIKIPDSVYGTGYKTDPNGIEKYAFWKLKSEYYDSSYRSENENVEPVKIILPNNPNFAFLNNGVFGRAKVYEIDFNGAGITKIKNDALSYNHLTSIEMPSTVANIYDHALWKNHLSSVMIPEGVLDIGIAAFDNQTVDNGTTNGGDPISVYNTYGQCDYIALGTNSHYFLVNYNYSSSATDAMFHPDTKHITTEALNGFVNKGTTWTDYEITVTKQGVTYVYYPYRGSSDDGASFGLKRVECENKSSVTTLRMPDFAVTRAEPAVLAGFTNLQTLETSVSFSGLLSDSQGMHLGKLFAPSGIARDDSPAYVPSSLTTIVLNGVNDIGYHAFYNCSHVESVTINNTEKLFLKNNSFEQCTALYTFRYNTNLAIDVGTHVFDNTLISNPPTTYTPS